jgi:hypothetical protein
MIVISKLPSKNKFAGLFQRVLKVAHRRDHKDKAAPSPLALRDIQPGYIHWRMLPPQRLSR